MCTIKPNDMGCLIKCKKGKIILSCTLYDNKEKAKLPILLKQTQLNVLNRKKNSLEFKFPYYAIGKLAKFKFLSLLCF